jgi:hypothetical protein
MGAQPMKPVVEKRITIDPRAIKGRKYGAVAQGLGVFSHLRLVELGTHHQADVVDHLVDRNRDFLDFNLGHDYLLQSYKYRVIAVRRCPL